jgi:hypothetical protein
MLNARLTNKPLQRSRKLLLVWLLMTTLTGMVQAQDLILQNSGDEINVKITEITPVDILYKKPDSLAGRTFIISKKDVFQVKYANGTKELMLSPAVSLAAMFDKGRQDARQYYNGNGAMWGSAGSLLLLGISGPILVAAIPPKIKPEGVPDIHLLKNPDYVRGYKKQAHKRKVGKAAAGAGIGLAAITAVFAILLGAGH